jgi:hypothetical protein
MSAPVVADIVGATQDFLQAQFGPVWNARVVVELPGRLESAMPVIQVVPVGGPLRNSLSHASVSIQVYAVNSPTAMRLNLAVINAIRMVMPATALTGVSVTGAQVNSLPQFWDYDNPNVHRTVSLIDIYCHPA